MVEQAAGRVPVYFGIGAISTKKCCRLAKMAVVNGAAGVSVLQPMFLKPTEAELFLHFKTIAESVPETPVLLYNNPGRVNYTLSGNLVERLAHEVPNIVGMKDTSGDITQTAEFIRRTRDVDFKVFGGKDTLLYASMCHGAVGGVCTAANFMPELITDIYNKFVKGDFKGSLDAQFKLNPVMAEILEAIDMQILVPGAVGCLVTGIVYGIFTNWGFFKHKWLVLKWVLTIFMILFGTFYMGPLVKENVIIGKAVMEGGGDTALYWHNVSANAVAGLLQLILLTVVTVVSVYKPWKRSDKRR